MKKMWLIFPMILIILITTITMKLSLMFSKKIKMHNEKMTPFECGFNPINKSRIPFSMRFFLITIIFLIFDIEIALLIPMIYTFEISNSFIWMSTSITFMIILLMGLLHEWKQGALNWL